MEATAPESPMDASPSTPSTTPNTEKVSRRRTRFADSPITPGNASEMRASELSVSDEKGKTDQNASATEPQSAEASAIENTEGVDEKSPSTRVFQWKSTAHSVFRSLNMYRESVKLDYFDDDWRLFKVAMEHSRRMAMGETTFSADAIGKALKQFPFIDFFADVTRFQSMNNAFTNAVNQWTTDNKVSRILLKEFNCAGVGVYVAENGDVYFTLILALRTVIGHSYYSGTTLRSILLAEQCSKLLNRVRHDEFGLLPIRLDLQLCDMAYRFANMDTKELTKEYLKEKIGVCSEYRIAYGGVDDKKATPKLIVENWMNQMGKGKSMLGDFNRIGIGFIVKKDTGMLFSVCVLVRTLEAAVLDGTETIVDGTILANQIFDMMNEFRDQHSLKPLNYDTELCVAALDHAEYIANGQKGPNPLDGDYFVCDIEPRYVATDISHMSCCEMSRAPKVFMEKWRNNVDCISVLLNQIDDIGIGVCFDKKYVCHITAIIASHGNDGEVTNIIYRL